MRRLKYHLFRAVVNGHCQEWPTNKHGQAVACSSSIEQINLARIDCYHSKWTANKALFVSVVEICSVHVYIWYIVQRMWRQNTLDNYRNPNYQHKWMLQLEFRASLLAPINQLTTFNRPVANIKHCFFARQILKPTNGDLNTGAPANRHLQAR
jgi:hypothetical protein